MTDATLDWKDNVEILPVVIRIINLTLMVAALYGATLLLNWVVEDKIARTEIVVPTKVTAAVRDKQLNCLAMNIYHEAGSEPFEGKVAVAQVTLNRSNSGKFPSDICKVVYQKDDNLGLCQFSWFCTGKPVVKPNNNENYTESMEVAKKVLLEGFRLPSLNKALYFHGSYINPGWNRKRITQIGNHIFYE